jgi:hypothetical protein
MLFAYLAEIKMFLNEYWWVLVVGVFMAIMFTGRRIDRIIEWMTDRKMRKLYPKLTKKYDDDIFDYDAYITELLGVNVKLDDLIRSVERINKEVFQNRVQRVTYLELWILVRTYGKRIVKSDEHIYYIDKKNLQKDLELDLKEVNRWVIEFVNSQEIRSLKIEASFILHKIRVKDPSCDPNCVLQDSAVAAVVFEKDYVFALRSIVNGEIKFENTVGVIELKDGGLVEISESGIHFVGSRSDMTALEKMDVFSLNEMQEVPYGDKVLEEPKKESTGTTQEYREQECEDKTKEKNKKPDEIKIEEIDSDGSVTYVDKKNRKMTKKSKLEDLNKTDVKTLFDQEDIQEENVPVKVKSFGSASNNSFKTLFDEQSQAEEILMQKFKSKKKVSAKETIPEKEKGSGDKKVKKNTLTKETKNFKNFDLLREFLKDGETLLSQFFEKGGVLYFDEETEGYLISVPHLLFFAYELLEEKTSMIDALFPENSQPDQEKIYTFTKEMLSSIVSVESIERGSFHRAEEGYKEVYTFAMISGLDAGSYIEYMVRGKYDKKYKKFKIKIFAEQFLDIEK